MAVAEDNSPSQRRLRFRQTEAPDKTRHPQTTPHFPRVRPVGIRAFEAWYSVWLLEKLIDESAV